MQMRFVIFSIDAARTSYARLQIAHTGGEFWYLPLIFSFALIFSLALTLINVVS